VVCNYYKDDLLTLSLSSFATEGNFCCECYTLTCTPNPPPAPFIGFTNFQYNDCSGNTQTITVADGSPVDVCAEQGSVIITGGDPGGGSPAGYDCCDSGFTPTPTPTPTETPTNTPTQTPTNTQTQTQTGTPTQTPTNTETPTPTNTQTPTPTNTQTPTNTETPTPTNTQTPTNTETPTPTNTQTPTNTETPTQTPTPGCYYIGKFLYSAIDCGTACSTIFQVDLYSNFDPIVPLMVVVV
jgi:hypothetical protein